GRKWGNLGGFDPRVGAFNLVAVLEKTPRRRTRGAAAIGVVCAAVTWAHEQSRLRIPPDRAAKMRAIDGEDLQFVGRDPPHPTRDVPGVAVPGAHKGGTISRQPGFAFRELRHSPWRYPRQFLLRLLSPSTAAAIARHSH